MTFLSHATGHNHYTTELPKQVTEQPATANSAVPSGRQPLATANIDHQM